MERKLGGLALFDKHRQRVTPADSQQGDRTSVLQPQEIEFSQPE